MDSILLEGILIILTIFEELHFLVKKNFFWVIFAPKTLEGGPASLLPDLTPVTLLAGPNGIGSSKFMFV